MSFTDCNHFITRLSFVSYWNITEPNCHVLKLDQTTEKEML